MAGTAGSADPHARRFESYIDGGEAAGGAEGGGGGESAERFTYSQFLRFLHGEVRQATGGA